MDPMSMGTGGGSPYMQDLVDKLGFARTELLGRMSLGEMGREWYVAASGRHPQAKLYTKGITVIAAYHQHVPSTRIYC